MTGLCAIKSDCLRQAVDWHNGTRLYTHRSADVMPSGYAAGDNSKAIFCIQGEHFKRQFPGFIKNVIK
jgi:hypothetical protein